ncbi:MULTISPECIES: trehalase-like domain-containing protein [unclassified Nocardioides]|uniref:trehalase-like domain-containing protein n=1 Tax=unclassified Nocardioides TaxID=2615069 RepID=UPI00005718D9|nr:MULTISPECIES: trehalase-like domain-containing protein [unclassified Nocardioides]ABL81589.1 hypothetical protein Noca_2080 [Nocardioides sp. JS614]
MTSLPIGGYALLSDRHSAALVSSGVSVDWLCMPRFDSPSVFATLLDDQAGHRAPCRSGPVRSTASCAAAAGVRAAVETDGWDEGLGALTQSFGSRALDATVLLLPIVGFLPADDPRVDSSAGELLGNFPQTFSQIGLVNAAWALDEATRTPRNREA